MITKRLSILLCLILLVQLCGCALPEEYRFVNTTEPIEWDITEPKPTVKPAEPKDPTPVPEKTAAQIASELSREQLVAQLFLVKCPAGGAVSLLKEYDVGGIVLYGSDTAGETPASLRAEIAEYQTLVPVPLLIAVDEEGGTVNRISNREAFRSSPFPSIRDAYDKNGIQAVRVQEAEKSRFLKNLGINVNLGPICDLYTDEHAFIADRAMGLTKKATSEVVAAVVEVMHENGVGAVLKHFPGYGNAIGDTHNEPVFDDREAYELWEYHYKPFQAGIKAGAGAVMVNHCTYTQLDPANPASLSGEIIGRLRDDLGFKGVIITDDITMGAITLETSVNAATIDAILAGSDMILTSWSEDQYRALYNAVYGDQPVISEQRLMESVVRIIQWKLDLGLL